MDESLREFLKELAGAIAVALVPVILVAFMAIPFTLGGHPGEITRGADPFAAAAG
jgi:hypothetical protein